MAQFLQFQPVVIFGSRAAIKVSRLRKKADPRPKQTSRVRESKRRFQIRVFVTDLRTEAEQKSHFRIQLSFHLHTLAASRL